MGHYIFYQTHLFLPSYTLASTVIFQKLNVKCVRSYFLHKQTNVNKNKIEYQKNTLIGTNTGTNTGTTKNQTPYETTEVT